MRPAPPLKNASLRNPRASPYGYARTVAASYDARHQEGESWSPVASVASEEAGRGRVARPFGFALTDPGRRLSRTRLFPEVTRIAPRSVSRDG